MANTRSRISILITFFLCIIVSSPLWADGTTNPDEALKLLKEGNGRFIEMKSQHPNDSAERRQETAANGQKPFAIILGCSDSRAPVEMVFDRGIGDIFVVRVAGNIAVDNSIIGSIEYAAEHLGAQLLIIMGHTRCGAVEAAVKGYAVEGSIREIQKQIEPLVMKAKKDHPGLSNADVISSVTKNNVLQAKEDILMYSHMIEEMVSKNKMKIATAVYDIETGKVEWIE